MTAAMTPEQLQDGYETVIVAAVDMQGRLLGRRLPVQRFLAEGGVDLCSCVLAWDIAQSAEVEVEIAGFHTGWHDWRLVADAATLRPAAWLERTAFCTGDLVDEATHAPVAVAPRAILRRQVERLAQRGLRALVATELEFYLYATSYAAARGGGYRGLVPSTGVRSDYAIQAGDEHERFFAGLRRALQASGIEVGAAQAEWGLGQWEVNLVHGDPLELADRHALLKLATRSHAAAHGLAATFMARPHADDVGSSCHVHLSLVDDGGTPCFTAAGDDALTGLARAAVAGAVERLGEAMLWYAPTVNAYRRTSGDGFAGRGRTWGHDNRTVSVRVAGSSDASRRIEVRVPGADANPYLALAAVIASVLDGIEREADPGEPVRGSAYALDLEPLPGDLRDAAAVFAASPWARDAFGDDVVDHYAAVARHEWAEFGRAVTDWELGRYFEGI